MKTRIELPTSLQTDEDDELDASVRVLLTGAACVIEEYALSKHFNRVRDIDVIRRIANDASKLNVILMLAKDGGKDGS